MTGCAPLAHAAEVALDAVEAVVGVKGTDKKDGIDIGCYYLLKIFADGLPGKCGAARQ